MSPFFSFLLPRELFQLRFGVVQAVPLYVFMGRVGKKFMKRKDVAGNLHTITSTDITANVQNTQMQTCAHTNERQSRGECNLRSSAKIYYQRSTALDPAEWTVGKVHILPVRSYY